MKSNRRGGPVLVLTGAFVAMLVSACGAPDATTVASGLTNPSALLVSGTTLFWLNDPGKSDSSIQSVPTGGGKVTTVLAQANLDLNLATDGTLLYFSYDAPGTSNSTVASCRLDGSNVQTLNSDLAMGGIANNHASGMFFSNGTLYVNARYQASAGQLDSGPFVFALPAGGGAATVAVPMGVDPVTTVVTGLVNLYRVDSSGIYYSELTSPPSSSQATDSVNVSSGGGSSATLDSVPNSTLIQTPIPAAGGLTVVGNTAFFLSSDSTTGETLVLSSPATGGSPTTVATLANHASSYLVGDANGLFIDNEVQSNQPGILSVTLSGTATSYVQSQHALSTSVGQERIFALDAQNLYWIAGGFNGGQGTVHAKAR